MTPKSSADGLLREAVGLLRHVWQLDMSDWMRHRLDTLMLKISNHLTSAAASGGEDGMPDGYVMVPRVPTSLMVEAGRKAMEQQDPVRVSHARVMWLWNDMLAATPAPSPLPQSEGE